MSDGTPLNPIPDSGRSGMVTESASSAAIVRERSRRHLRASITGSTRGMSGKAMDAIVDQSSARVLRANSGDSLSHLTLPMTSVTNPKPKLSDFIRLRPEKMRIYDDSRIVQGYARVPLLTVDHLPRGGVSVATKAVGRVQFGIPPESIKDSMQLGLDVPRVYIVPMERFCREMGPSLGINLAEFEFPAYFNFFVRQKRCVLVVDSTDAEKNIRSVFEETLLGPKQFRDPAIIKENEDTDFGPDFPLDARPNFYKEFMHFRIIGKNPIKELTVDTLLDFCHFKKNFDFSKEQTNEEVGIPPVVTPAETIGTTAGNTDLEQEGNDLTVNSFHGSLTVFQAPLAWNNSGIPSTRTSLSNSAVLPEIVLNGYDSDSESQMVHARSSNRDLESRSVGMESVGVAGADGSETFEDESGRKTWMYSQVKWLGEVATVWPMDATPDQIKNRSVPRVEIFKMPGGSEYVIHDVDENNIIVGKARFSGSVRVPEEIAVVGYVSATDEIPVGEAAVMAVPRLSPQAPTFHPPSFGLTVLGNSHGFDKNGSTSGYVVWVNGRGIMIDPPPYSSATLEREGIRPPMIFGVIITHCHADHDAGAFQKLLTGSRLTFVTSPTIYSSFIRKYSALSGLDENLLRQSHRFRPAIVGQPLNFQGAAFHFSYTLHTIPCLAFKVEWRGRSMVFTGDHLNLPPLIDELEQTGVLSKGRAESLRELPIQDCDVLLHEAGAPPVHTPISVLENLPSHVKERLYVVHTSALPPDSGLRVAPVGTAGTIRLDERPVRRPQRSAQTDEVFTVQDYLTGSSLTYLNDGGSKSLVADENYVIPRLETVNALNRKVPPLVFMRPACTSDAWFVLNLLSNVPFFTTLSYANTMDVLDMASIEVCCSGDVIVPASRRDDVLCVVWEGTCIERINDEDRNCSSHTPAVLHAGDWTGPSALQVDNIHLDRPQGDIVAVSEQGVKVIILPMVDLSKILKQGSSAYRGYLKLEASRYQQDTVSSLEQQRRPSSISRQVVETLTLNSLLGTLPDRQKRVLESIAEGPRKSEANSVFWNAGDRCEFAFLVVEGTLKYDSKDPKFKQSGNLRRESSVGFADEFDKLLVDVSPSSEYARLEAVLMKRSMLVANGDYNVAEDHSRIRFANKVLLRLYASQKFTEGTIFSAGCFVCDTSRMVSGELIHQTGDTSRSNSRNLCHSSTIVAGPDGCIAWVFPRATLVAFLISNPGLLLSLLGTQAVF